MSRFDSDGNLKLPWWFWPVIVIIMIIFIIGIIQKKTNLI